MTNIYIVMGTEDGWNGRTNEWLERIFDTQKKAIAFVNSRKTPGWYIKKMEVY